MKVFKVIICLLVLIFSPVYLFADADPSNPVTVEECNFPEDMNCFVDGDIAEAGPINANFKALLENMNEMAEKINLLQNKFNSISKVSYVLSQTNDVGEFTVKHGVSNYEDIKGIIVSIKHINGYWYTIDQSDIIKNRFYWTPTDIVGAIYFPPFVDNKPVKIIIFQ